MARTHQWRNGKGFLHGRHAVRSRQTRHADLPGGDIWAGAVLCAVKDFGEAVKLINAHEFGNGVPATRATGTLHANSVGGFRWNGGNQRADPRAHGLARVRRWKTACSATCTPTVPKACASTLDRSRSCSDGRKVRRRARSSRCRQRMIAAPPDATIVRPRPR